MKITLTLGFFLTLLISLRSQSGSNSKAIAQLDSVLTFLNSKCSKIEPNRPISKKLIRQDKKTIELINTLYYDDISVSEIERLFSKDYKRNWRFNEITQFGETILYEGTFAAYGNLRLQISIATIDGDVVSKKFILETKTQLDCKTPYIPDISFYDVPYILNYLIPFVRPKIYVFEEFPYIVMDTTLTDRLTSIDSKYRSLLAGDSSRFFNDLTWHSFHSYMYWPKLNPLNKYLGNYQIDLVKKLLYSPNHIVAIYAYEIVKDLKIDLTPLEKSKLESIYNSPIKIKWWSSDVGYSGKTYKELRPNY